MPRISPALCEATGYLMIPTPTLWNHHGTNTEHAANEVEGLPEAKLDIAS